MAPEFKYKPKVKIDQESVDSPDGKLDPIGLKPDNEIEVKGLKEITSDKVKQIVENDLNDLKAHMLQDEKVQKGMMGDMDAEVMNKVVIPKLIKEKYPDLDEDESEQLRQQLIVDTVIKGEWAKENTHNKFITMTRKFINVAELDIELIDQINPFQKAFEVLSKDVNSELLAQIHSSVKAPKMTTETAYILWPKIKAFVKEYGHNPKMSSPDPLEAEMARALDFLRRKKAEAAQNNE